MASDDKISTTAELAEAAVLRLGRAAHSDPNEPPSPEERPLPASVSKKPVEKKSAAEWAYERLILYIKNFEALLDSDQEIAMGFTEGGAGVIRIEGIGYFDPDIVTFYGTDATGARTQLVPHVTQLNVLLRAVPKPQESDAPRRIGFRLEQSLEES